MKLFFRRDQNIFRVNDKLQNHMKSKHIRTGIPCNTKNFLLFGFTISSYWYFRSRISSENPSFIWHTCMIGNFIHSLSFNLCWLFVFSSNQLIIYIDLFLYLLTFQRILVCKFLSWQLKCSSCYAVSWFHPKIIHCNTVCLWWFIFIVSI